MVKRNIPPNKKRITPVGNLFERDSEKKENVNLFRKLQKFQDKIDEKVEKAVRKKFKKRNR